MTEDAVFEKILFLLTLAEDPRTPSNEAYAARRAAEKRMAEAGLTRKAVQEKARARPNKPPIHNGFGADTVIVGDPLLVVTEHPTAYRVAKLTPPLRFSSHFVLLPKRYVRAIQFLTEEDVEAMGWKRGDRITRAVVLDREYLSLARSYGWHAWV